MLIGYVNRPLQQIQYFIYTLGIKNIRPTFPLHEALLSKTHSLRYRDPLWLRSKQRCGLMKRDLHNNFTSDDIIMNITFWLYVTLYVCVHNINLKKKKKTRGELYMSF